MSNRIFLTDKEVASVVGVSQMTVTRICNGNFGKHQKLLLAKPEKIGEGRRWNIYKLASVLGISVEEIERAL